MDMLVATYLMNRDNDDDDDHQSQFAYPLGVAVNGAVANSATSKVKLMGIISLLIGVYAAYLSWTSNAIIDGALERIAPGSGAGGVIRFFDGLQAFGSGFIYLLFYYFSKSHRMEALAHLVPKV